MFPSTKCISLRKLVFGVAVLACSVGCSPGPRTQSGDRDVCVLMDSLYQHAGFHAPLRMNGKATVDANQYRLRGIIQLEATPSGDVLFEFTSSILFGNQVEDFFCSVVSDTLRIVDRERGEYYEGDEAERLLGESLDMDFAVREALRLAFGARPPCDRVNEAKITWRSGRAVIDGRLADGSFQVEFSRADGRLKQVLWPLPDDVERGDRMRVEYEWAAGDGVGLREMVIHLEQREWRCKLVASSN